MSYLRKTKYDPQQNTMVNTKLIVYALTILLTCQFGYAQTPNTDPELDRLHIAIKQANTTQNKVNKLLDLCYYFTTLKAYNTDSLSHYSRKTLQLITKDQALEKEQVQALAHLASALSKNPKKKDSALYYLDHAKTITKRLDYKYGIVETSRLMKRLGILSTSFQNILFYAIHCI